MKWRAGLTVEAALVLPIFLYAIVSFLSLFFFLQLQVEVQSRLTEISQKLLRFGAVHGYLKENFPETSEGLLEELGFSWAVGAVSDALYLSLCMEEEMEEEPLLRYVKGGAEGFRFEGSSIYAKDGEIDIVVSYEFQTPGGLFSFQGMPVVQRVHSRAFRGDGKAAQGAEQEAEETLVYVTQHGEVYHCSEYCRYLKATVRRVRYDNLHQERNASGGIYYSCQYCKDEQISEYVFVTPYGTSYHTSASCHSLRKKLETISLEEAKERGLRKCSGCAKEE